MTRIRRYIDEVVVRTQKVTWPTREQVRNLTVLVFVVSVVVGVYIAFFDCVFQSVIALHRPRVGGR